MPRTARASQANNCYHVLNRGNARAQVFHKLGDYASFVEQIEASCRRRPMRVFNYGLMPNHFHLALKPIGDGDLGTWMQWLMTSHFRVGSPGNGPTVSTSIG